MFQVEVKVYSVPLPLGGFTEASAVFETFVGATDWCRAYAKARGATLGPNTSPRGSGVLTYRTVGTARKSDFVVTGRSV